MMKIEFYITCGFLLLVPSQYFSVNVNWVTWSLLLLVMDSDVLWQMFFIYGLNNVISMYYWMIYSIFLHVKEGTGLDGLEGFVNQRLIFNVSLHPWWSWPNLHIDQLTQLKWILINSIFKYNSTTINISKNFTFPVTSNSPDLVHSFLLYLCSFLTTSISPHYIK